MAKPRVSQLIIWLLIFIYTLLAIILYFWQHIYGTELKYAGSTNTNLHGRLSLIGLIFCGAGMCIYRLFRGYRTRIIKYIHFIIQTFAVAFIIAGVVIADDFSEKRAVTYFHNATEPGILHVTCDVHITIGYMMFCAILAQFIFALIAFVLLCDNNKKRLLMAPFHEIIGIWILISLVMAYLSGVYFQYDTEIGHQTMERTKIRDILSNITVPAYLSFLIVLIIVLTPYFEWDLVGPL